MNNAVAVLVATVYVHFTSAVDAAAIVASGVLRSGNFGGAYAVAAGGRFVPSVQHTSMGVAAARDYAVVFTAAELPDLAYPEEVVWKAGEVAIQGAFVVTAEEAAELLDGSVAVVEIEGAWGDFLDIPSKLRK